MRVTLMHNPEAGTGDPPKKTLIRHLERDGHKVTYQSTKEKDFAHALVDLPELVVIAGGDGTVTKVAMRLIGRNVPLAIVPLGTANNIARTLGLNPNPLQAISALASARSLQLDVGIAHGPWGDIPFLEAAGTGLLPKMMATRARNKRKKIKDAVEVHGGVTGGVELLLQLLTQYHGREFRLAIDGVKLSGSFLMIEVMNIRSIGPALPLAPHAHPGDGLLDVVLVRNRERHLLQKFLKATLEEKEALPPWAVRRARQVQLFAPEGDFHCDDELWPGDLPKRRRPPPNVAKIAVDIGVLPGALRVLVP